jgi:hypothetical protein
VTSTAEMRRRETKEMKLRTKGEAIYLKIEVNLKRIKST